MYSANAQLKFSAIKIDTADTYIGVLPANNIEFDVVFDALTNEVVSKLSDGICRSRLSQDFRISFNSS